MENYITANNVLKEILQQDIKLDQDEVNCAVDIMNKFVKSRLIENFKKKSVLFATIYSVSIVVIELLKVLHRQTLLSTVLEKLAKWALPFYLNSLYWFSTGNPFNEFRLDSRSGSRTIIDCWRPALRTRHLDT